MTELQLQLVKGAGFAAAAAFALLLQRRWPHARQAGSWRINGAVWALDVALLGALCGACACTAAAWAAEHQVGVLRAFALPGWLAIAVTIVALDGVSYAWHRANHRLHFLWRFHRVHHSDPAFTVSTAVRFHPGELLLAVPLRLAAIVLLGAPVVGVVLFEAVFACANFVEHGDIALPAAVEQRLRRFLITPGLHRLHHSQSVTERDSNFGTICTLWDRGFGTLVDAEPGVRVHVGLAELDGPTGIGRALMMPMRRG